MKVDVYNIKNEKVGTAELPDRIFNVPWKPSLVHQVLLSQKANRRRPWASAKDRSEVSGGGRKPWRQKGTGRARHGSTRSPIWRSGGKAHGPLSERSYEKKVNKKMRRAALSSVLSQKLRDAEVRVFDTLAVEEAKTKRVAEILRTVLGMSSRAKRFDAILVPSEEGRRDVHRAARNLLKTKVSPANALSVEDLLTYKHVLLDKTSVAALGAEERTEEKNEAVS